MLIKRGEIYICDLGQNVGSEQCGLRPVIVIQNNVGNKYSPTVVVSAITSSLNKAKLPTHVNISSAESGLSDDSIILLEQIRTLDKSRLKTKIGNVNSETLKKIDIALAVSIGIGGEKKR